MTSLTYRPPKARDWRLLAPLYRASFPAYGEGLICSYCLEYVHDTEIAFEGDELAGAIIILPRPDDRQMWLELIAVSRSHRRRGLGAVLLARVEQQTARRGYTSVGLKTRIENHAAHRLYENAGYERRPDPDSNDWIFEKAIVADCEMEKQRRPAGRATRLYRRLAYRTLVTLPETGSLQFSPPGTITLGANASNSERLITPLATARHLPRTPAVTRHQLAAHPLFERARLKTLISRLPPEEVAVEGKLQVAPYEAFDTLGQGVTAITASSVQYYDIGFEALHQQLLEEAGAYVQEMHPRVHHTQSSVRIRAAAHTLACEPSESGCLLNQIHGNSRVVIDQEAQELAAGHTLFIPPHLGYQHITNGDFNVSLVTSFQTARKASRAKA